MDDQLLKDPEIEPTNKILKKEFGDWYPVYKEFASTISSEPFSLKSEWKYYKDGKAWLCKISRKKKTVVWLSAWKNHFKLGFYFTEKTGTGIPNLEVCSTYRENYETQKPIGKLKPLVAEVNKTSQLEDIYTLIEYKVGKL